MSRRAISKAVPPIFVGKWTTESWFSLHERLVDTISYNAVSEASRNALRTRTLRNLESARLIARSVTGPDARAVEYSLTQIGRTFIVPLTSMCKWARQHRKYVAAELSLGELKKEGL